MRYTSTHQEINHLIRIHEMIGMWGVRHITLLDGRQFTGLISSNKCGNNGIPPTAYYGEVSIFTLKNETWDINLLDIASVLDVTDKFLGDFEKAGLIEFVDFSKP